MTTLSLQLLYSMKTDIRVRQGDREHIIAIPNNAEGDSTIRPTV
jgi:hypothetical protein